MQPVGKVLRLESPGRFQPRLLWQGQLQPLGEHPSEAVAQAAYDAGKLLLVLKLGGDVSKLKLHRPAAAYTQHPLWARLAAKHLSYEEACSLLAGGLAADLLEPAWSSPRSRRAAAHPATQQQQQQQQSASLGVNSGSSGSSCVDGEHPEWQPDGSEGTSGSSGGSELEAELSDDESDADSGGSWGRPAKRQRQQLAAAPPGSSRGGGAPSNWSGLEPADSGSYALTVPPSAFKPSGSRKLHVPARYSYAMFGFVPAVGAPARTVNITALPDGSEHVCSLVQRTRKKGCILAGFKALLDSLGASQGDQLCLRPTRKRAAEAWLVPAEELATSAGSRQQAAAGGSRQPAASSDAPTVATPAAAAAAKRCSHCDSDYSPCAWARDPATRTCLCSTCRKYQRLHDGQLPPEDVLERRRAMRKRQQEEALQAQARQQPQAQLTADGSTEAALPAEGQGSAGTGTLPAPQELEGGGALLLAFAAALAALEEAGVPPATVAAFRRSFMGLPSTALRRANYSVLHGYAERGDAAAAAAWMAEAGGAA